MEHDTVASLMISLDDYAVVPDTANLSDIIGALKLAEERLGPRRQPPRAVLVADRAGTVIGQLGQLDVLKALEPKYNLLGNLDLLSRAGVREDVIDLLLDDLELMPGSFADACRRARDVCVKEILRPLTESIDEDTSLTVATHKFVLWQTPRILVTRQNKVVGILRLADLFAHLIHCIETGKD